MAQRVEDGKEGPDRAVRRDVGIVVPLRSFTFAKARLSDVLDPTARALLARGMADRVVRAAGPYPVAIVSSALEVCEWAVARDLDVVGDPGSLDSAAAAGREWARECGFERFAIVHADLPRITTLDAVVADGGARIAVVVPDHRHDGTPVLSLPTDVDFTFAYGPDSASRHVAEAERLGLEVRVVNDPDLAFDVDVPADLAALVASEHATTS
jgi:2-phospho-L-lactate guanylyltransferase